ncbi:MAG: hypothetical protein HPY53_16600 [Brevinematales bacterium]|nr:hypothetical protein [Brevinematales bacterium]
MKNAIASRLFIVILYISLFLPVSGISARNTDALPSPSQTEYDNHLPELEYALPVTIFKKMSSSSTLKPQGSYSYSIRNLFDRDLSTCWSEGVKGPGEGEWIEFELKGNIGITEIWIGAGYLKNPDTYKKNSFPATFKIELFYEDADEPNSYHGFLEITGDFQDDMYNGVQLLKVFDDTMYPEKIRMTIETVYPGTKYDDTCISELYFFGYAEGDYKPLSDPNNPEFDPPDLQGSP